MPMAANKPELPDRRDARREQREETGGGADRREDHRHPDLGEGRSNAADGVGLARRLLEVGDEVESVGRAHDDDEDRDEQRHDVDLEPETEDQAERPQRSETRRQQRQGAQPKVADREEEDPDQQGDHQRRDDQQEPRHDVEHRREDDGVAGKRDLDAGRRLHVSERPRERRCVVGRHHQDERVATALVEQESRRPGS